MKKNITKRDVAREAGVSHMTVTRVLSGYPHVSSDNRKKVLTAVNRLNYKPNLHAQALVSKRSYVIGVVMSGLNGEYWPQVLGGIEKALSPTHYQMLLATSYYFIHQDEEAFLYLDEKDVDGFIYSAGMRQGRIPGENYALEMSRKKPVVCITNPVADLPGVFMDEKESAALIAETFYRKGHRKVACLNRFEPYVERVKGFVDYCAKMNIEAFCFNEVDNLIENACDFTAVFCAEDHLVVELYNKLLLRGLEIPDDISIAGFDNLQFLDFLTPRPTALKRRYEEIAFEASTLLLDILEGKNERRSERKFFNPELTYSESIREL